MSKKSENNISTERILKSKYLDKDKQKTLPLIKHKPSAKKIKLVDLCPEEKLKIGELIKALDERRIDNQKLTTQIDQLNKEIQQLKCDFHASSLEAHNSKQKNQEKEIQVNNLNQEIKTLRQQIKIQHEKNKELSRQSQEYCIKLQHSQSHKKSALIQTESDKAHEFTQTVICVKETGMQTEKQEHERDLFYRPHSKSFEKIMKGPISVELPKMSAHNTNSYQTSKGKTNSKSHGRQSLTENRSNNEQLQDEDFDELNQRWNQLKVKHQRGKVDWEGSPHSFHISEAEKSSSKKKSSKMDEIDEITLNKMLRLKDFSASKLMRVGKQLTSSSKSKKEKQSPEVNYLKSPYFNRIEPDSNLNTKTLKPPKKSHFNSENQINFYESGLFDAESSLE